MGRYWSESEAASYRKLLLVNLLCSSVWCLWPLRALICCGCTRTLLLVACERHACTAQPTASAQAIGCKTWMGSGASECLERGLAYLLECNFGHSECCFGLKLRWLQLEWAKQGASV